MHLAQEKLVKVVVAGAVVGAAIGGTLATVHHGLSGVAFWVGLAVGAVAGPICLTGVVALFEVAQVVRRRTSRRA